MPVTLYRPYTTLLHVQRETKNRSADVEDFMRQSINDASRAVEEITGRDFWFHDHSTAALAAKQSWVHGREIYLPYPVITLTSVRVNGVALDSTEYKYENADRTGGATLYRRGSEWNASRDLTGDGLPVDGGVMVPQEPIPFDVTETEITLVGTFGYTVSSETSPPPSLPQSIQRATTLIASVFCGEDRKEWVGLDGGKQSLTEFRIPKEAKDLLSGWKRLVL